MTASHFLKIKNSLTMRNRMLLLASALCSISFFSFSQNQKFDLKASVARGQEVYLAECMSCHLEQGEGIPDVYPPLAKSDYLMADRDRSIKNVLHGLSGEIVVNGKTYSMEMIPFTHLSDQAVSDVLNYIRNAWGNKDKNPVTPDEVKALRK
jgi:mono/diheme cytochrome c family protein